MNGSKETEDSIDSVVEALLVLGIASLASSKSSKGDSVLVILDPKLHQDNYSIFFNGLRGKHSSTNFGHCDSNWYLTERGYNLTFRSPKDAKPAIIEFEQPQFSHVILFAPETKSKPTLSLTIYWPVLKQCLFRLCI